MMPTQYLSMYHHSNEYQNLFNDLYDPETGEINEQVDAQLLALSSTLEKKCLAIGSFIQSIKSNRREIEFLKAEVLKREAAYDKELDKWQTYLKTNMEKCGIQKVECPYFTIKLKKNPYSTEVLDESLIPNKYIVTREVTKIETRVDKNAIKEEVLKTGEQIPGVIVQQKTKLEITIDKI